MATGKTNTIIIRDETKCGSSKSNNVTRKDFNESGTLKPKRSVTGNKRTGRVSRKTSNWSYSRFLLCKANAWKRII
mgnify:CR=1 FL=1